MDNQEERLGELSYDEHCRILDEISESGCLWLLFTGGEIFARKDFLKIYTYAKKKGLLITLFTNGTLLTPEMADYLAQWVPFSISVTLYGRTRATYERITRVPGSFEKCMRGIRLLLDRDLPLSLKTAAITVNRHELWEMKQFVEQDLGTGFQFDSMINPRIDCSTDPLAVRLSAEEVVKLDLLDSKRIAEWKTFAEQFKGPVHSPEHRDEIYHCGGGINSFAIDPQGRLRLCALSQADGFDLRKGCFLNGWQEFVLRVRRRKLTRVTRCVGCEIKAMCGMCPANAELEEMDPEAPVDFMCRVAHLRMRVMNLPVPAHGRCDYCEGGKHYLDLKESAARLLETCPPNRGLMDQDARPEPSTERAVFAGACTVTDPCSCPGNSRQCTYSISQTPATSP